MTTQTAAVPLNWNQPEGRLLIAQTATFRFEIRRACLTCARIAYRLSAYVHGSPRQVHFRRFKWLATAQAGAQRFAAQHGPRPAHEPNLDDQHFWYLLDAHGCTVFKRYVAHQHALRDLKAELPPDKVHYLAKALTHGSFWWQPSAWFPTVRLMARSAIEREQRRRRTQRSGTPAGSTAQPGRVNEPNPPPTV
jgi:hypothetical protein